ncbi:MAG: PatB family C-S lyase [Clostridiales bacterium]|nr:PatB family C-S lyase [Clostridiales bacterium]
MKYNFDEVQNRMGSDSIKWEKQLKFGAQSGLLPFWIADTDFATLPEAVEAMKKRVEHPLYGYTFSTSRTRETVRKWYERRHQVKLPPDAFVIANGVVTDLWFTIRALTKPGDPILVLTPVYDPFFAVIRNQDRVEVDCPLCYEDGRYEIDWEALENKLQGGVRAMIFCNPHNPVGRVWTEEDVYRIVDLCKKYSVYLLSDEVHGDIVLYGGHYTSAARFADHYDSMIVYTAISKTFNMAGLESSCCLIPNQEVRKSLETAMKQAWLLMGTSVLTAPAIEACYTYGDQWVDELNAYLTENAEYVIHYLQEHAPQIRAVKPEGTYLMWLDCSGMGMTSGEIVKELAQNYQLAVGDGAGYGGGSENFLRFNIGCPRATLRQGLERLAKFAADKRR